MGFLLKALEEYSLHPMQKSERPATAATSSSMFSSSSTDQQQLEAGEAEVAATEELFVEDEDQPFLWSAGMVKRSDRVYAVDQRRLSLNRGCGECDSCSSM